MGNDEDIGTYEVDPEVSTKIRRFFSRQSSQGNLETSVSLHEGQENTQDRHTSPYAIREAARLMDLRAEKHKFETETSKGILTCLNLVRGVGYPLKNYGVMSQSELMDYFNRVSEEIARENLRLSFS